MATLDQIRALKDSSVRLRLANGTVLSATIIDVQDNVVNQVSFEVQQLVAPDAAGKGKFRAGHLYAVSLDDIVGIERLS